jgi:hypothetical protein
MLRPTVRYPSGTCDQFFFLLEILFRQLHVCHFVAPSLMRGRVCNLLLLLVLASAVPLESESRGTQDHILLYQFLRLPQPEGPGPGISKSKSTSHYDRQSVGQSVFVSGAHLGPATNFTFSLKLYLDNCGFVVL